MAIKIIGGRGAQRQVEVGGTIIEGIFGEYWNGNRRLSWWSKATSEYLHDHRQAVEGRLMRAGVVRSDRRPRRPWIRRMRVPRIPRASSSAGTGSLTCWKVNQDQKPSPIRAHYEEIPGPDNCRVPNGRVNYSCNRCWGCRHDSRHGQASSNIISEHQARGDRQLMVEGFRIQETGTSDRSY